MDVCGDGKTDNKLPEKAADDSDGGTVTQTESRPAALSETKYTSSDVEEVFARFESFNFDQDENFQRGLSKITAAPVHTAPRNDNDFDKIKAFYYSRNIEFFEYAAYIKWRQSQVHGKEKLPNDTLLDNMEAKCCGNQNKMTCKEPTSVTSAFADSSAGVYSVCAGSNISSSENFSLEQKPNICCGEVVHDKLIVPDDSQADKQLSFAEIAELIQEGKSIPGLVQVDVVPTNLPPTPSCLPRAKKPWEE